MKKICALALLAIVSACSNGTAPAPSSGFVPGQSAAALRVRQYGIAVPPGYHVSIFARGTTKLTNPDPIEVVGSSVYVAYQNNTQPTGSGGKSTIVQYNAAGKAGKSISLAGRCDGMRWNAGTKLMWITINEDANSKLYTWDPSSGAITKYAWSSAKHGGGYDDLAFANGMAFVAASNPKLNAQGKNTGPAMISAALSGSTAMVTPVLMGNATATDIVSGKKVTLNLTDPDSMTVAPTGQVVLVSQGDSEIVFVGNAGMKSQSVSRLLVGTQLDDTVFSRSSNGKMLVVDAGTNTIYKIAGRWAAGGLYTEAPSDSGVAGFVGTVDLSTGTVTPMFAGFNSPTGLVFMQ